ncbi:hypothetical protein [Chitinophaga agri]|uniref:Lipoprotein n=1 Tax=Chitinophaga agri TaxID=2703787 RepID=A0A6B9ZLS7_9BACT|nr:hypothetical protein [Chitinophaga agri]QHS62926.1 hypothetical protein GWR21_26075 [Chitinophaga agri]
MKKLAFCLLAAIVLFTACGKVDPISEAPANSFSLDGQDVVTPYGYLMEWGAEGSSITFADKDLLVEGFSGDVSAVGINLDTIISGQTYTYKNSDSTGYDKKKNFESATVYRNQPFARGEFTDAAKGLDSLTGGSVTIRIVEGFYSVVYDLKYTNTTVKGEFNDVLFLVK